MGHEPRPPTRPPSQGMLQGPGCLRSPQARMWLYRRILAPCLRISASDAPTLPRIIRPSALATTLPTVAFQGNKKAPVRGFSDGRYWARTSDPQLVDSGQRSRPFAQVRSNRMVERNSSSDRTVERTRTNSDPCHSCHAAAPACATGALSPNSRGLDPRLAGRDHQHEEPVTRHPGISGAPVG